MGAFKRSLFGYNRKQVEAATKAWDEQRAGMDRELLLLSEMLMAREREAETLRVQLADAHARHDRSLRSLEVLAGHLDELQAQARGQATRIRMKALDEAALVTERANEALAAVRHLQEVKGVSAEAPVEAPNAAPAAPAANHAAAEPAAAPAAAPQPTGNGEIGFYQGDIEVEIGPLGDFSQLLGFESAAGTIEGARDISVRRFASGRATLGLRLDEPIELLRELEERAPFEFKVRQTGGRRLVLDIDGEAAV